MLEKKGREKKLFRNGIKNRNERKVEIVAFLSTEENISFSERGRGTKTTVGPPLQEEEHCRAWSSRTRASS